MRRGFPGEIVDALAGALREALTNVVKHADVEHAVVWAEVRAGVVRLSVLDQLGGVRHGGAAGRAGDLAVDHRTDGVCWRDREFRGGAG